MYTQLESAIHFVFEKFNGKKRTKEDIPLAFHSVSVAFMLVEEGCNYETVLTGLLHDIIEDSEITYEELKSLYGENIANKVLLLSEDQTISDFYKRKEKFIDQISKLSNELLLIEIADKLQNLLSDYEYYQKKGQKALSTDEISYDMNKWYYRKLLNLFESKITNSRLLDRYREIVNIYFKEDIYE